MFDVQWRSHTCEKSETVKPQPSCNHSAMRSRSQGAYRVATPSSAWLELFRTTGILLARPNRNLKDDNDCIKTQHSAPAPWGFQVSRPRFQSAAVCHANHDFPELCSLTTRTLWITLWFWFTPSNSEFQRCHYFCKYIRQSWKLSGKQRPAISYLRDILCH